MLIIQATKNKRRERKSGFLKKRQKQKPGIVIKNLLTKKTPGQHMRLALL